MTIAGVTAWLRSIRVAAQRRPPANERNVADPNNVLWGVTGGIALALAYPPASLPWIAWVALTPLLRLTVRNTIRQACLPIFLGGLCFHFLILNFMRTAYSLSTTSWTWGEHTITWLIVSTIGAVSWLFVFGMTRVLLTNNIPALFAFPVCWTVSGELWTTIMSWTVGIQLPIVNGLALTQVDFLPWIQIGDLGGEGFVSWTVLAFNGFVLDISHRAGRVRAVVWMGLLSGSVYGYGLWCLTSMETSTGPTITLCRCKWPVSDDLESWRTACSHDDPTTASGDLIVLGENTLPQMTVELEPDTEFLPSSVDARTISDNTLKPVAHMVEANDSALATGTGMRVVRDGKLMKLRSLIFLPQRQNHMSVFHKINLAPIEIAPTSWQRLLGMGTYECTPGTQYKRGRFQARNGRVYQCALGICYDGVFSQFYRGNLLATAQDDLDFFLIVADENADGSGVMTELTLRLAQLRSVECRRSTARNASGGISAVIDSCGRIVTRIDVAEASARPIATGIAPDNNSTSFYVAYGRLPWLIFSLTWLGIGAACRTR